MMDFTNNNSSTTQSNVPTTESDAFKQKIQTLQTLANVLSHEQVYKPYASYLFDLTSKLPTLIRTNRSRATSWKSILDSNNGLKKLKMIHTVPGNQVEEYLTNYIDVLIQFLSEFTGTSIGQQTTANNAQSFAANLAAIAPKYMSTPNNELINFEALQLVNVQIEHQKGIVTDLRSIIQQFILQGGSVLGQNRLTGVQNYLNILQQDIARAKQAAVRQQSQQQQQQQPPLQDPNDFTTQLLREISNAGNNRDVLREKSFLFEWIKNPQPDQLQLRIDRLNGFLNSILDILKRANNINWSQIEQQAKNNPFIAQQIGVLPNNQQQQQQNNPALGAQNQQQQRQQIQKGRQINAESDIYRLLNENPQYSQSNGNGNEFIPYDEFLKLVPQAIPNTQMFQQQREESKQTLANLFSNNGLGFAQPVIGSSGGGMGGTVGAGFGTARPNENTPHNTISGLSPGQFLILKLKVIPGNYSLPQSVQFLFKINQKATQKPSQFLSYHIFSLKRILPLDNAQLGNTYFPATDTEKNPYAFWAVFVETQTEFVPVAKYQTMGICLLTYPSTTSAEFFNELQANFNVMVDNNIRPQGSVFKQHAIIEEMTTIRSSEKYQLALRLESSIGPTPTTTTTNPIIGQPAPFFQRPQPAQSMPSNMQPFVSNMQSQPQQFQQQPQPQQPFQNFQSSNPAPISNPNAIQPTTSNSFMRSIRRSTNNGAPSLGFLRAMTKEGEEQEEVEQNKKHH